MRKGFLHADMHIAGRKGVPGMYQDPENLGSLRGQLLPILLERIQTFLKSNHPIRALLFSNDLSTKWVNQKTFDTCQDAVAPLNGWIRREGKDSKPLRNQSN